jgi:hypothetical protein
MRNQRTEAIRKRYEKPTDGIIPVIEDEDVNEDINKKEEIFKNLYDEEFCGEGDNKFLPIEKWAEWVNYRKEIKHKLPKSTARAQLRKLRNFAIKGIDPIKIINQSIENGWQGLFEIKVENKKTSYQQKIDSATYRYPKEERTDGLCICGCGKKATRTVDRYSVATMDCYEKMSKKKMASLGEILNEK